MITILALGRLVIKNKALGGPRRTQRPRFKATVNRPIVRREEERIREEVSQVGLLAVHVCIPLLYISAYPLCISVNLCMSLSTSTYPVYL